MNEPSRRIVHLDADAFFVGCELASLPSLRGQPVAVGGSRRGIIASASYEARRMGVYTPMPTSKALRVCPQLIVLEGNYEKYEELSRKMFDILEDFTPLVERSSIDEGYADITSVKTAAPRALAELLGSRISRELGLSVSLGIASNKLISAIASKLKKPNSIIEVPPLTEKNFLAPLSVRWLPGVGEKTALLLESAGLKNCRDIAIAPLSTILPIAGSRAKKLKSFAMGIDDSPLIIDPPHPQSYGKQETFSHNTQDRVLVKNTLRSMVDDLMTKVRADSKMIRCVDVFVRYPDMRQIRRSTTLADPTDLETDIYPTLDDLLDQVWCARRSLRLVGVKLSRISETGRVDQIDLGLPGYSDQNRRNLAKVVDEVRIKYGQSSVVRAHRLKT